MMQDNEKLPQEENGAAPKTEKASMLQWAGTRLRTALFANPVARGLGNWFYALGFGAQYICIVIFRRLRDASLIVLHLLGMLFGALGRQLKAMALSVGQAFMAPFARFGKRRAQIRRVRQRARSRMAENGGTARTFLGAGAKSTLQLVLNTLGFLLPVAAAVVLVFTVYSVVGMKYGLSVEINGQVLGYVSDQSVVENAKGLLRDRIKLAGNQELSDWQLNPTYAIARAGSFTTTQQLANEILLVGSKDPGDLVEATGLYIDGSLFAVTTEGERLKAYLDGRLDSYRGTANPDAVVAYVRQVECQPGAPDVFFASSVEPYDELIDRLEANERPAVEWQVQEGETLAVIAERYSTSVESLLLRNPGLGEVEEDHQPEAGTLLLVERAKPFLQIQESFRQVNEEEIPFETVETETNQRMQGVRYVVQEGTPGLRRVTYDYVYIDGELDAMVPVEGMVEVVAEAVPHLIEVGTQQMAPVTDYELPAGGYGGSYLFPVPSSGYSSRGVGAGHMGMDINATTGDPIFACEGGTVTIAQWHYSYGYYVVIAHPGDVTTLYAHCSALYVQAGQAVSQGEVIAAIGSTGDSTGPHCHLEVRVGGAIQNPVDYVGYPYK